MLPFWMSNNPITYSRAQRQRRRLYSQLSQGIICNIKQDLERYGQVSDRNEAFGVLLSLDELSLELSCYNNEWIDFSVAVFEVLVLPSKQSIGWNFRYLTDVLNTTLRRLSDSVEQITPPPL